MANIELSDLQPKPNERIYSEAELLDAVSDSVARAIKARGTTSKFSPSIIGRIVQPPITVGLIALPESFT
ncbi:hypothetical protein IFO70_30400 [Phormidium tenue FACHB-886]|nr:hypothetical protein [Phormidium tenue FACHB-886]